MWTTYLISSIFSQPYDVPTNLNPIRTREKLANKRRRIIGYFTGVQVNKDVFFVLTLTESYHDGWILIEVYNFAMQVKYVSKT